MPGLRALSHFVERSHQQMLAVQRKQEEADSLAKYLGTGLLSPQNLFWLLHMQRPGKPSDQHCMFVGRPIPIPQAMRGECDAHRRDMMRAKRRSVERRLGRSELSSATIVLLQGQSNVPTINSIRLVRIHRGAISFLDRKLH